MTREGKAGAYYAGGAAGPCRERGGLPAWRPDLGEDFEAPSMAVRTEHANTGSPKLISVIRAS
jgi:hypothetical protein